MDTPERFGRRLKRARIAQQLTLDDLVGRLGGIVTKAALSKYERGQSMPRPTVMLALCQALRLPASHLLGAIEGGEDHIEWLAYRKHSGLGVRAREHIEAIGEQRAEAQLHLTRLLHPDLAPCLPTTRRATNLDQAECAANDLRSEWGLGDGPIERLVQLVEDKGAIVVEGPSEERFDALSGRTADGCFVIVVNLSRSADRVRFNVAHELGHLVLDCHTVEPKEEEQLAHRFAASFLVPATAATRELGNRRSALATTELGHLKRKYGLSIAAWTRRARDLSIISEATYREWQVRLRSGGQYTRESVGYEVDERPERLRVLCTQAISERVIDTAWLRTHCPGVEPPEGDSAVQRRGLIRVLREIPADQRAPLIEAMSAKAAADYEHDPEVKEWIDSALGVSDEEDG